MTTPEIKYYDPASDDGVYDENTIVVFIFLGRGNPPQEAHYNIICDMILESKKHKTCALLLLGAGPGYEQTEDNPISYKERSAFLHTKLNTDVHDPVHEVFPCKGRILHQPSQSEYRKYVVAVNQLKGEAKKLEEKNPHNIASNCDYRFLRENPDVAFQGDFAIMLKNNKSTSRDISEFVKNYIEKNSAKYPHARNAYRLKIVQCAGTKDGDATKLVGTFHAAQRQLEELQQFGNVEFNVWAYPVVEKEGSGALSATKVREDARNCYYKYADDAHKKGHTMTSASVITKAYLEWKSSSLYNHFYDHATNEFFKQMVIQRSTGIPYPKPKQKEGSFVEQQEPRDDSKLHESISSRVVPPETSSQTSRSKGARPRAKSPYSRKSKGGDGSRRKRTRKQIKKHRTKQTIRNRRTHNRRTHNRRTHNRHTHNRHTHNRR